MGHPYPAQRGFDGGTLDCGSGLLLLIREHIDPLLPGQLLEIRSRERSVEEDLPAWCRMTGNQLVSQLREGDQSSFLVSKGPFRGAAAPAAGVVPHERPRPPAADAAPLPAPAAAPRIEPLSVLGVGSWPRPRWLLAALHERLERRLDEAAFSEVADDAVRLAVQAQREAGVDVLTDGEQRRDSYASFVGQRLEGCQLVPITDLLPYVDDPAGFASELEALDVPAARVRHPALFGKLRRTRPLALDELRFVQSIAPGLPVKVALPGPYLLSRTLFLECLTERAYPTREALAADVVQVLRAEVAELLAAGAALVQLDEPVLTEVVFGAPRARRSFMCGALGARSSAAEELELASTLLAQVTAGLPRERLALHVCRGNWTPDASKALAGDYRPLLPLLASAPVGTLFLEMATPRAGDLELLGGLPDHLRVAVGLIDQKQQRVEPVDEVLARARRALLLLGRERLLLTTDCGFATFAENPITSAALAAGKLKALAGAAAQLRNSHP